MNGIHRMKAFTCPKSVNRFLYSVSMSAIDPGCISFLPDASERELPQAESDARALLLVLKKRQDKAREYFDQLAESSAAPTVRAAPWRA